MSPIIINAIVLKEDGVWIAQCLEFNFVSFAVTLDELPRTFMQQVEDQIEADLEAGQSPFFGYRRAPQKYWDMFEEIKRRSKPIKPKKSLPRRVREFLDRQTKIDAFLFPASAAA
jgi:hypothetical protein